jgi:hypothetical protein
LVLADSIENCQLIFICFASRFLIIAKTSPANCSWVGILKWTPRTGTRNSHREYIPERGSAEDEKKRVYIHVEG